MKKLKKLNELRPRKMEGVKKLQEELKWYVEFDKNMLESTVYYDNNRYYIFYLDLFSFMKSLHNTTRSYVNRVKSCRTRKQIGPLLNNQQFSFIIVYYDTSQSFRYYVYTGMSAIRIAPEKISSLDLFSFEQWIQKREHQPQTCCKCKANARYYIHVYKYKLDAIEYDNRGYYCEKCKNNIPLDIIMSIERRW